MISINLNHTYVIRSLQLITHILAVVAIVLLFLGESLNYLYLSIFLYYFLGIVGINVGYHRYLAHKSFKTPWAVEVILTLLGAITVMGSSIAWVAVHRHHHQHSDTDRDPHSPHQIGVVRAWTGFWRDVKLNAMSIKDLRRSEFHKFIHANYLYLHLAWVALLFVIDPLLILFAYALPAVMIFHAVGAFDVIAHIHGYRTYNTADKSGNSWIASVFTPGEGWHNNHHANPGNWRSGERWWEFDPPAWVIKLIKKP